MTILTDDLFTQYGGLTGSTTAAQRFTSYGIAEDLVGTYLGTPLSPRDLHEEFPFDPLHPYYALANTQVGTLNHVWLYYASGTASGTHTDIGAYSVLVDGPNGIIFVSVPMTLQVNGVNMGIEQYAGVNVSFWYTAGMVSGSFSTDLTSMWALTMTAQLVLDELFSPGTHEVTAGVQSYRNMQYAEVRTRLYDTVFGSSAKANFITRLLKGKKRSRVGRI